MELVLLGVTGASTDCLRGKVYADLCSERKLEKGSGGVGAQPPRNF